MSGRDAAYVVLLKLARGHCMKCNKLYPPHVVGFIGDMEHGYSISCGVCGLGFSRGQVADLLAVDKLADTNLVGSAQEWLDTNK